MKDVFVTNFKVFQTHLYFWNVQISKQQFLIRRLKA